ncbi:MAG: hypothetical protein GWP10_21590 [Nitrospiraceae bacterium]|nr:hypothetical protein [Nitrospiraceae bacterium]
MYIPYHPTFRHDFMLDRNTDIFKRIRWNVVVRNESWDIFIAQRRGAGKSTVAIRLALLLDPYFTLDHICFTVSKFVGLLTSRQRPGTVIVFDDLGTQEGGSSRKWQKQEAQDLADIMQLNRTDGIITIATSLELERGEKRLRAGFSLMVDPGEKLSDVETGGRGLASRIRMRQKVVDVYSGKVRWQYLRYTSGGRIVAIDISHPPADFWVGEYQTMRNEFLDSIKEHRKDGIDDQVKPNRTPARNAEIAKMLHAAVGHVPMHIEALNYLHEQGAVSKETGITTKEVQEAVMRIFDCKLGNAAIKMKQWKLAHFATSKRSVAGRPAVWWLTEQGIKVVKREPLS